MKHNHSSHFSGIKIENTLSMAVQERSHRRNPLHLLLIAFCGTVGGIGTFLTMFQPQCHFPALLLFLAIGFAYFALTAYFPKKWIPMKCILLLCYGGMLYVFWKPFSGGFIHMLNTIYKVIYMTEWARFTVPPDMTERYCMTVFLIFALIPILYMLCHAAINYQNFFLCLIPTFPLSQIGFYYGAVPDHFFAILLLAFWFSMAAVHMSNSGTYHGDEQNSFLRRGNTFFPVSSMRFMVTEKIGVMVLISVIVLCLLIGQVLRLSNYRRSEDIKVLRSNVQDYMASVMLSDSEESSELWESLWPKQKKKNERIVTTLGEESRREFENIPLSGLTLSDLPEGRLYLKYRVGEIYGDNSWSRPEDSVYNAEIFRVFEEMGYAPQEFLHPNMPYGSEITMTFRNVTDTLGQCVPYAAEELDALQSLHDNAYSSFSDTYRVTQMQNFESVLLDTYTDQLNSDAMLLDGCREQNREVFEELCSTEQRDVVMTMLMAGTPSHPEKAAESALLCAYGYTDFVQDIDLQIPDTDAMQAVREAYASILDSFSAETADAAETIAFLQELRETVCGSMTYTLAPGRTPPTEDFVEHFLLQNNKGYCMHYATAGVMLARMAGIPARYCEGYMVDLAESTSLKKTDDAYTLEILDSNAHAWMEVYLAGWGWIPFEFTFTDAPQPVTTDATMPTTEPITSVVTSVVTSYVPAETEATAADSTNPAPDAAQKKDLTALWIVLAVPGAFLFVFLLIRLVIFLRTLAIRKRKRLFMQDDRNAAVLCIYAYLCRLLEYCGADLHAQRTADIAENAAEVCGKYLQDDSFADAVEIAAKAKFSKHTISEEERGRMLQTAQKLSAGIYQEASRWQKFHLRYILHLL